MSHRKIGKQSMLSRSLERGNGGRACRHSFDATDLLAPALLSCHWNALNKRVFCCLNQFFAFFASPTVEPNPSEAIPVHDCIQEQKSSPYIFFQRLTKQMDSASY